MLIGRVPAVPSGPQLREGETGKFWQPPCTRCELLAVLAGFLDSAQSETITVPSRGTTLLLGEQFHRSFSADPGKILQRVYFTVTCPIYSISKIIQKTLLLKRKPNNKSWSPDFRYVQFPGVPRHISPTWPFHTSSRVPGKQ
jgi:hypothetical protein